MSTIPRGGGKANTAPHGGGMGTVPQAGGEANTAPTVAWV